MQTLQPNLKRGRIFWDKTNMPVAEFSRRVDRIRQLMEKNRLGVLLLYGNSLDNSGNPRYISNYTMETAGGTMAVIPAEGKSALIFEGGARLLPSVKSLTWLEDTRPCDRIADECIKYLQERDLLSGTLGLAGLEQLMPHDQWHRFREAVKQGNLVDAGHIMDSLRMVKSPREIEQMRRSARITQRAFEIITQASFPALHGRAIEAEAERYAYASGAMDLRLMLARTGESLRAFEPPDDRPIPPGTKVTVYIAVQFEGYWTEGIRTFITRPPRLAVASPEKTEAAFTRVLAGLQPGMPAAQFYQHAAGRENNGGGYPPPLGFGNGLGLELEEYPFINESVTTGLEAGMCLALRLIAEGDIMTGHTVYLADDRAEILV